MENNFENLTAGESSKIAALTDVLPPKLGHRVTGSLGFEYEAQVRVMVQKHGNLEDIRHRLGLSKRKMAQLLMVDPSAWTRWTRPGEDAPPHVYRSLEWYLLLQDKYPGMDSPFWLESVGKSNALRAESEVLREGVKRLDFHLLKLQKKLKWTQLGLFSIILLASLVFLLSSCASAPTKFQPSSTREALLPSKTEVQIAKDFAPIFIHEVGPQPKSDVFSAIDFDSDWVGDNNWNNLDNFELDPMAYFEVFSTSTHHYIMYGIFHPRDYSWACLPIICHENDMEGVLVVVDRLTMKWIFTESLAHNYVLTQKNSRNQDRPTLVVEWGGHGIYPPEELKSSRPTKVFNPQIYGLEPIAKLWNLQFKEKNLFEGQFDYVGERFSVGNLPKSIKGRAWTKGSANPPWAWVDWKQANRGELFFDPAYYVATKHKLSGKDFDLKYQRHPYLPETHDLRENLVGLKRSKNAAADSGAQLN